MKRVLAPASLCLACLGFAQNAHGAVDDLARLQQSVRQVLAEESVRGVGIAIVDRQGPIWTGGVGEAHAPSGASAAGETLYRIGSVSKVLIGMAAAKLWSEGKLDLDAPIRTLVPELSYSNAWEAQSPIRVVHLLENTTGWDDLPLGLFAQSDPAVRPLRETLPWSAMSRVSRWRPGTFYSYSNANAAVTARIVELLTGKRYEEYVRNAFLLPLGMTSASFYLTPEIERTLTRLYQKDAVTEYPYHHIVYRPVGALNASPREMAELLRMFLQRGVTNGQRILPESAVLRMERPAESLAAKSGLAYGYGLHLIASFDAKGYVWYGHDGGLHGAASDFVYSPELGVGFFYSLNGSSLRAAARVGEVLTAFLTRGLPAKPRPAVAPLPSTVEGYLGWYRGIGPRYERTRFAYRLMALGHLRRDGERLIWSSMLGETKSYVGFRGSLYRREILPVPTLALLPPGDEGTSIQMVGGGTVAAYRRIPGWLVYLEGACLLGVLLACTWSVLRAGYWVFRHWIGRNSKIMFGTCQRWTLAVAALLLVLAGIFINVQEDGGSFRYGVVSVWSLAAFGVSIAIPFCTLMAARSWWKLAPAQKRSASNGISLAAIVLYGIACCYLGYWGMLGIRTWE